MPSQHFRGGKRPRLTKVEFKIKGQPGGNRSHFQIAASHSFHWTPASDPQSSVQITLVPAQQALNGPAVNLAKNHMHFPQSCFPKCAAFWGGGNVNFPQTHQNTRVNRPTQSEVESEYFLNFVRILAQIHRMRFALCENWTEKSRGHENHTLARLMAACAGDLSRLR